MRVVIAGAGSVGRSIARELIENGHEVLLIDSDAADVQSSRVPDASWLLADACELTSLEDAGLEHCDVVVAATGDDKANLVVSLLAKTEFGVPRTVARVNNPKNEWMFDSTWGVDVAVSTPRLMTALIEEAVSVGDLVRIFEFSQSEAVLVELTLPEGTPWTGQRVIDVPWPIDTVLTCLVRQQRAIAPSADDVLEVGDELILVTSVDREDELARLLNPDSQRGEEQEREEDLGEDAPGTAAALDGHDRRGATAVGPAGEPGGAVDAPVDAGDPAHPDPTSAGDTSMADTPMSDTSMGDTAHEHAPTTPQDPQTGRIS